MATYNIPCIFNSGIMYWYSRGLIAFNIGDRTGIGVINVVWS